jgi:hypothetical protein
MPDLHIPTHEAHTFDFAAVQHLDEIIAELRDQGTTPSPLNVLHYALELGLSEGAALNLAAIADHRLNVEVRDDTNKMAFDVASDAMRVGALPGTRKFKNLVKKRSSHYPNVDPLPAAEIAAEMVRFAQSERERELFSRLHTILEEIEKRGCLTSSQLDAINDALNGRIAREEMIGGEIKYTYRTRRSEGWDQQPLMED